MHRLAKTLTTCGDVAADEQSQLTELTVQACSLIFHQVTSNLPGLVLRSSMIQEALIPASYAHNQSCLLVSHQQPVRQSYFFN